jgi:hypothetical protein
VLGCGYVSVLKAGRPLDVFTRGQRRCGSGGEADDDVAFIHLFSLRELNMTKGCPAPDSEFAGCHMWQDVPADKSGWLGWCSACHNAFRSLSVR